MIGWFERVALLGAQLLEGDDPPPRPALDRALTPVVIHEMPFQRGAQERAEPAPLCLGGPDGPVTEEPHEEALRRILGIRPRMAAPTE